jgi:hypothetical protein
MLSKSHHWREALEKDALTQGFSALGVVSADHSGAMAQNLRQFIDQNFHGSMH